ncbi:hypothetical protein GCM10023195_12220 [Actinoallomurus liliacearum]|uniref:Uncharacterized protein n=1 Tax=Actinoallomurus liliacearum TaxID=1080073 RepID=A0ABP8TGT7_9ACTN
MHVAGVSAGVLAYGHALRWSCAWVACEWSVATPSEWLCDTAGWPADSWWVVSDWSLPEVCDGGAAG